METYKKYDNNFDLTHLKTFSNIKLSHKFLLKKKRWKKNLGVRSSGGLHYQAKNINKKISAN
jgi:phage pi2 protein 07